MSKKQRICPTCNGDGDIVLVTVRPGKLSECPQCQGAGKVDPRTEEWERVGSLMKLDRRNRKVSFRDEARSRGILAVDLLRMENGWIQPSPREEEKP